MKRHLLIIAVCLLLGAVVNVAVAWGPCAVWGGRPTYDDRPLSRFAAQRLWDRYAPEGWPPFDEYDSGSSWGRSGAQLWSSCYVDVGGVQVLTPSFTVSQVKVGSPFRTFQYGWYYHDGEAIPPAIIISYETIWPGFAINTLFYATALWLLIAGPFVLRRFLRLRRGLCPKCAYPMGESSVCTECGCGLPKRARTT